MSMSEEIIKRSCQPWWSSDQELGTPLDLFKELDREFHFNLDVCASAINAKTIRYYTKEDDGLKKDWNGRIFCNPPYGDIDPWIEKGIEEINLCEVIVYLLPSRTDRPWFHSLLGKAEIRFLDHRLRFEGTKAKAQFACFIGVLRNQCKNCLKHEFGCELKNSRKSISIPCDYRLSVSDKIQSKEGSQQ